MVISHDREFVVMAPWKTASSTVATRLRHVNQSQYSRFYAFNPLLNRVVHQHLTRAELASLPEGRGNYRVLAFTRHPYDRVYSGFRQLLVDIRQQPEAIFSEPWVRALVLAQLAENFAQLARADFDFDLWVETLSEYQVLQVGRNSSLPMHPAHYWTHFGGNLAVDFIGKVETFEADFERLCAMLDIETPERIDTNRHPPDATDQSSEAAGASRYAGAMARRSIDKINSLFEADFALFGYERL